MRWLGEELVKIVSLTGVGMTVAGVLSRHLVTTAQPRSWHSLFLGIPILVCLVSHNIRDHSNLSVVTVTVPSFVVS